MYISVNVLLKFTNITTQFTTQNHYTVYHTDLVILNTANLPRIAHSRVCIFQPRARWRLRSCSICFSIKYFLSIFFTSDLFPFFLGLLGLLLAVSADDDVMWWCDVLGLLLIASADDDVMWWCDVLGLLLAVICVFLFLWYHIIEGIEGIILWQGLLA